MTGQGKDPGNSEQEVIHVCRPHEPDASRVGTCGGTSRSSDTVTGGGERTERFSATQDGVDLMWP